MKRLSSRVSKIAVLMGLFFIGSGGPVPAGWAATASPGAAKWSVRMQELYRTLASVLTDVSSDRRFNDPLNRARIQKDADHLAGLVREISGTNIKHPDLDPTIPIISGVLAQETQRAANALRRGNRSYARSILRSVPGYCIACHTRNATGPLFARLPLEPNSSELSPLDRGEFFAASRQFDRAQDAFKKVIQDTTSKNFSIWDWEKAVNHSLAIAVRVKKDPAQAQSLVQMVLDAPNVPAFTKEDAKSWKTAIAEWQQETPRQAVTEEGLYAEAMRLMARAKETQKYPVDRTADVFYLRASAAVHELLQLAPQGVRASDALLLAGLSYEVLNPLKTDSIHEIFYETCIRNSPHTSVAELCYQRLESAVIFGYTGSLGADLPDDVKSRLSVLKSLSQRTAEIRN